MDLGGWVRLEISGFDTHRRGQIGRILKLPWFVTLVILDRRDRDQADQVGTGLPVA